jgi:hypothetical protein
MIFLANRGNLDQTQTHREIHDFLASRVDNPDSPVLRVKYHPSMSDREEVRAEVDAPMFAGEESYDTERAELQVGFEMRPSLSFDNYSIRWVESEKELMVGWHQDDTHPGLGECHFQIDHEGECVQRTRAEYLDDHPLNILGKRLDVLPEILRSVSVSADGTPSALGSDTPVYDMETTNVACPYGCSK